MTLSSHRGKEAYKPRSDRYEKNTNALDFQLLSTFACFCRNLFAVKTAFGMIFLPIIKTDMDMVCAPKLSKNDLHRGKMSFNNPNSVLGGLLEAYTLERQVSAPRTHAPGATHWSLLRSRATDFGSAQGHTRRKNREDA